MNVAQVDRNDQPGLDLIVQKKDHVIDEQRRILEQRAMPGVGIQDQLCILEMLEHEVRIPVGKHSVVAPTYHQNGLADGLENRVFGIFGCAPVNQCFGLWISDSFATFRISIHATHTRALYERAACSLAGLGGSEPTK